MVSIVFALVGAVVAVFAGILFIQRVISARVHVLLKRELAGDFVVADLDAMNTKCTRKVHPREDLDLESNQLRRNSEIIDRDSFFETDSSIPSVPSDHSESSNMSIYSSHEFCAYSDRTALTGEDNAIGQLVSHSQRDRGDQALCTQYESNGVRPGATPVTRALSVTQRRDLETLGLISV